MKKTVALVLGLVCMLSGCRAVVEGVVEGYAEARHETGAASLTSEMAQLPADAGIEDMMRAFEADYTRAAQEAGVTGGLGTLEYEAVEGSVMIDMGSMTLMIDPPASYYRVWYAGYPESDEWMYREAELLLIAWAPDCSQAEAAEFVQSFFNEAWNNRNNMPSAVDRKLLNGLTCSLSLNERGLVSYWIAIIE